MHFGFTNLIAAATAPAPGKTAWQRLEHVPAEAWYRIGIFAVCVLVAGLLLRRYLESQNKVLINFILLLGLIVLFGHWVQHRNEPAFLTPTVDAVNNFFNGFTRIRRADGP